jgi:hypothetical protein
MLIATPVWADWVEVAFSDGGAIHHIDPTTIRKEGNFSKVWTMDNLPSARTMGGINNVWSMRSRMEYDCKQERMRSLSISAHSEMYARGETLGQENSPTQWMDIPPNSIGIKILTRVCNLSPANK